MAKGKKTGGRSFKPGNKANPKGGGAITPETRALRKITVDQFADVADVILFGNLAKLVKLVNDPATSVLQVWLAKSASEGIKRGDLGPLEIILNRLLGKPNQAHEIKGKIRLEDLLDASFDDEEKA